MEDVAMTIPEPQWAKLTHLKAGDTVELHGFDCAQGTVTLEQDMWGSLFFQCAEGRHYVDSQLDQDGYLIGITIRLAQSILEDIPFTKNDSPTFTSTAKIIPLTSERIMNLDANDANSVSSFFQSLADKVVLASTLPQKVEELSAVVDKLKADVENYREHMARADEEISNLRRERAALQDENAMLRKDLEQQRAAHELAESRWNQACNERDRWHNDFIQLSEANETAKRERDDAQLRIMQLEDDLKRAYEDRDHAQRDRDEVHNRLTSIRNALA